MIRRNIFGMWVDNEEKNESEKAVEYICELKKELDGTELVNSGIALNNKFFCEMFLQLFEKYPPTIVDIANFMKQVKESSTKENKE